MKYVQGPMTTAIIAPSQTMDSLCLLSLSLLHSLPPNVWNGCWSAADGETSSAYPASLCFHKDFFIMDKMILIVGISFNLTSNRMWTQVKRMSSSHFFFLLFCLFLWRSKINSCYVPSQLLLLLLFYRTSVSLGLCLFLLSVQLRVYLNFNISILLVFFNIKLDFPWSDQLLQ